MTTTTAPPAVHDERYQWTALINTTAAMFMSALDGSIVIIAMPAIFRGIGLDPLAPRNISYLLWMILGYRLVQAVLVVSVGRLGDMFGRVKIYNAGFAVFTLASILLSFDPYRGGHGALWLIIWRMVQAVGGSMLMANSAAILTDAFPRERRGFALGINQVAGLAGQFIGLVAGGVLVLWDWRAIFWVNVPVGVFGTIWAYTKLRETAARGGGRIDWWGNLTFGIGLSAVLVAITDGLQPYHGHAMAWTNPAVYGLLIGGGVLLVAFVLVESKVAAPMIALGLFRIRAFTAGNLASFAVAIGRGGLQFILVIWLQGIWLPLHGYNYSDTPLWAGIFLLPLTAGFLIAGPISGTLSDRFGARGLSTAGALLFAATMIGLLLIPVNFPYWLFALIITINGVASGMFGSPNTSSIMSSVSADDRGVASGMRSTFMNSGTALSNGVFFALMIAGLAATLPHTLTAGLQNQGVSAAVATQAGNVPPVATLFSAMLGVNPIQHLLAPSGTLATLPVSNQQTLTGHEFFPDLISAPFHHGLVVVFVVAAALAVLAALASSLRGRPAIHNPTQLVKAEPMPVDTLDPRTALIVIDLQKGLANAATVHPFTEVTARAAELITAFRRHDLPVVLVNATGRAPGRTDAGRRSGPARSPDWADLLDELDVQPSDHLVSKQRWGAFHNTSLHEHLQELGVTQVVIAGIATSIGVESTARFAHEYGYHVVLAIDAMTDVDANAHDNSIQRIFPRLGQTATTTDIVALLDRVLT